MEDLVRHALDAMGVWSVFVLSAVGPYVFPAAGEIAIVLAAGTRSSPLWQIAVLATAGGIASDHAAYWVGRIGGSRLVARFLTPQRRIAYEERVGRHAPPWLVLGRLVTGVRTYLAVAAGAARYSYGLFNRIGGLLLRFKFNEHLSVETRSGDQKSMDLLYTVEKD